MSRQRAVNNLNKKSSRSAPPPNETTRLNGSAGGAAQRHRHDDSPQTASRMSVAGALLDYSFMLFLVIGGCCSYVSTSLCNILNAQVFCSNVWAFEELLRAEPNAGAYQSPIHPPVLQTPPLCWV